MRKPGTTDHHHEAPATVCDLRLHQLVTVRVAGATPAAASRLNRLLPGPWSETNGDRADLVLRQVDRLALGPGSEHIGQVSFDAERLVLQRRGREGCRGLEGLTSGWARVDTGGDLDAVADAVADAVRSFRRERQ